MSFRSQFRSPSRGRCIDRRGFRLGVCLFFGHGQAPANVHGAGCEEYKAEHDFQARQPRADALVAACSNGTFRKIDPDEQAHPAVGVHAVFEQASEREGQGQHFEGEHAAAGASPEQFPSQAEHDQAKQAGNGERS